MNGPPYDSPSFLTNIGCSLGRVKVREGVMPHKPMEEKAPMLQFHLPSEGDNAAKNPLTPKICQYAGQLASWNS